MFHFPNKIKCLNSRTNSSAQQVGNHVRRLVRHRQSSHIIIVDHHRGSPTGRSHDLQVRHAMLTRQSRERSTQRMGRYPTLASDTLTDSSNRSYKQFRIDTFTIASEQRAGITPAHEITQHATRILGQTDILHPIEFPSHMHHRHTVNRPKIRHVQPSHLTGPQPVQQQQADTTQHETTPIRSGFNKKPPRFSFRKPRTLAPTAHPRPANVHTRINRNATFLIRIPVEPAYHGERTIHPRRFHMPFPHMPHAERLDMDPAHVTQRVQPVQRTPVEPQIKIPTIRLLRTTDTGKIPANQPGQSRRHTCTVSFTSNGKPTGPATYGGIHCNRRKEWLGPYA